MKQKFYLFINTFKYPFSPNDPNPNEPMITVKFVGYTTSSSNNIPLYNFSIASKDNTVNIESGFSIIVIYILPNNAGYGIDYEFTSTSITYQFSYDAYYYIGKLSSTAIVFYDKDAFPVFALSDTQISSSDLDNNPNTRFYPASNIRFDFNLID